MAGYPAGRAGLHAGAETASMRSRRMAGYPEASQLASNPALLSASMRSRRMAGYPDFDSYDDELSHGLLQ